MAKRKKLNKRVVVFLSLLGFILLGAISFFVIKNLPQDPELWYQKAMVSSERGQYSDAEKFLGNAVNASKSQDPKYFVAMAKLQQDIIQQPGIPTAEIYDRQRRMLGLLNTALILDPNYVDAQQMLTDFYWELAIRGQLWREYVAEVDKLLKMKPDDAELYFRRGLIESFLAAAVPGTYTEPAIADFRKAISLDPTNDQYWLGLINFHRRADRNDQAEETYLEALDQNPADPNLLVQYGDFLRLTGRTDEALEKIETAIAKAPQDARGYLAKADFYMKQGDIEKTLQALAEAKRVDDTQYPIYYALTEIYNRQGKPDLAIESIHEGLDAVARQFASKPSDEFTPQEKIRLQQARIQLSYALGGLLLDQAVKSEEQETRQALLAQSKEALEQIRREQPDSPLVPKLGGQIALVEGDREKAIPLLEQAYEAFKGDDLATAMLLVREYRLAAPGKAEKIVDELLSSPKYENNPMVLVNKLELQIRYHRYEEAQELIKKILSIDPGNTAALSAQAQLNALAGEGAVIPEGAILTEWTVQQLLVRAQNLWANDEKDQAIELLEELRQRDPKNLRVVSQLLSYYTVQEQMAKARSMLQETLTYYPDDKSLQERMLLLDEPDQQKRFEMRLKFADENPNPLERALEKSVIYGYMGDEENFIAQMKIAESIAPDSPGVVEALFRVALAKENWADAQNYVQRAKETNMDGAGGKLFEARLAIARKQYPEAQAKLKEILVDNPESKLVLVLLGDLCLTTGDNKDAYERYKKAADIDPSYIPAAIGMARVTQVLNQVEEHREWVNRARKLAPQDPAVIRMYLAVQQQTADPKEVIPQRELILKNNPEDTTNQFNLARLYMEDNQLQKAEALFLKLWEDPTFDNTIATKALVDFYVKTQRYNDGVNLMEKYLAKAEDKIDAYIIYAKFLSAFDEDQAAKAFQKAIDINPADGRGYLALADFRARQGNFEQAAELMKKYLADHPGAQVDTLVAVRYEIEAGQLDSAEKELNTILARNAENAEAVMLVGEVAFRRGDYNKAESFFNKAISLDEKNGDFYYRRFRLRRVNGDLDQARRDIQAACQYASNPAYNMQLGIVNEELGDLPAAEIVYRDLLEKWPNQAAAMTRLMGIYFQERRWTQMSELLTQAKSRFPRDPYFPMMEAKMELGRGQINPAMTALESCLRLDPNYLEGVRMYFSALLDSGQYQKTEATADRYMEKPEFKAWVSSVKALALMKQGFVEQAQSLFREAFKTAPSEEVGYVVQRMIGAYGVVPTIDRVKNWSETDRPGDWRVYVVLGDLYRGQGDFTQAIDAYQKARQLTSSDMERASASQSLGAIYYAMQNYHEAEQAYLEVLKSYPSDLAALNNLAYMYTENLNQPEKALPYAEKAARLLSTDGNVLDTYGWTLLKLGKLSEAENQLSRSVQILSSQAPNRYHLGLVHEQRGRLTEARSQFEKALEIAQEQKDTVLETSIRDALERVRRKIAGEE